MMSNKITYPIIDAHVHVIERLSGYGAHGEMRSIGGGLAKWATGERVRILPESIGDSFSPERLIDVMDAHNVEKAIMMQGSYYGFCNDYTFEAQKNYPNRLFGMGTFDPYSLMAEKIMDNLVDNYHFKGLKFEMSESFGFMGYQPEFNLLSREMEKVWIKAQSKKLVISLDMGTFGELSLQINELAKIANQLPMVNFVVEHLFFPHKDHYVEVTEALCTLEPAKNICFSVASIPTSILPEDYPYPSAQKYIRIAKEIVGAERLLWGSDLPSVIGGTPYNNLIQYLQLGLFNEMELKMLFHDNASRIYSI